MTDVLATTAEIAALQARIAELERALEQARRPSAASEQLYRLLARNFPNGTVVLFDHDLRYTLVEGTEFVQIQVPRESIEGRTIWEVVEPAFLERTERSYRAVLAGQQLVTEFTFGGQWYECHMLPIRDQSGAIQNGLMMTQNITRRKHAEDALRESEQRYRAILNNTPVIIFTTDMDGTITLSEGLGLRALGLQPGERVGQSIFTLYADIPDGLAAARQTLQGLSSSWVGSISGRFFDTRLSPLHDAQGVVVGLIGMAIDITDQRRAERALEEQSLQLAQRVAEQTAELRVANEELASAARLKDEFLASMSHELRTPLNAMLGMTEGLRSEVHGRLTDPQREAIQIISESGRHLLDLINDILDLARIGAGKMELQRSLVPVERVCLASLRLVGRAALDKRQDVRLSFAPGVEQLWADERRLKQILVNLLSNAIKFTGECGQIGLETSGDPERKQIMFTVWDTGIGIAAEDSKRLFDPFVQLDSGLTRHYEGSGLGLALVQRLTQLHNGTVQLHSVVGQGSRFTVTLPWEPYDHADDHQHP